MVLVTRLVHDAPNDSGDIARPPEEIELPRGAIPLPKDPLDAAERALRPKLTGVRLNDRPRAADQLSRGDRAAIAREVENGTTVIAESSC